MVAWTYTYDGANRLREVRKNATVLGTYYYDANGIRAKKVENGQTTVYLALGHKNLYERTGTVSTKHIFAGTQRIAEVRDGQVFYLHNNHLGSPRVMTSEHGFRLLFTRTGPFGQPYPASSREVPPPDTINPPVHPDPMSTATSDAGGADCPAPTRYIFTGKELDSTGLYYFAARYYDPSLGRFISQDTWEGTLEEPWTQNRYVYVGNNPLKYVDPTGNVPELDQMSGSGGFVSPVQVAEVLVAAGAFVTKKAVDVVDDFLGSVWQFNKFLRGRMIERALTAGLNNTIKATNFPVIDHYAAGVATSVKSMDLSLRSYQQASRVTSTLMRYVNKLAQYQGKVRRGTSHAGVVTERILQVALPEGPASFEVVRALIRVAQRAKVLGVQVQFVIVP